MRRKSKRNIEFLQEDTFGGAASEIVILCKDELPSILVVSLVSDVIA